MTLQADFSSQDYYRNPAGALERLRALGPVVQVRFPILGTVWATTTQALADQVLKDTATFTIREEDGRVGLPLADRAQFAAWAGGFTRLSGADFLP
jgi:cytochrome P450 PksS